jgi:hypothetical protein
MELRRLGGEESFSLDLFEVQLRSGASRTLVPIVDRWLQLSIEVRAIPSAEEGKRFFQRLTALTTRVRARKLIRHWFFVHKPPGLLVRLELLQMELALTELIPKIDALAERWMGAIDFDSYLAHRELFGGAFPLEVHRILSISAEHYCLALRRNSTAEVETWADFTLTFLGLFVNDRWHIWEALGRFERFVQQRLRPAASRPRKSRLLSPAALFEGLRRQPRPRASSGFEASVAMLQCLNYIYNQWLVDPTAQRVIIRIAREKSCPEIARRE